MTSIRVSLIAAMTLCSLGAAEIYVSPSGNDSADGSAKSPVKTISRAIELSRKGDASSRAVIVNDGIYMLDKKIQIGSADNGLVIKAAPGAAPRIIGGFNVPRETFTAVTDPAIAERLPQQVRGKVLELDLKKLNVKHLGPFPDLFGNMNQSGNGGIVDLYFNGKRQNLARWPNVGYTTMKEVLVTGENRGKAGKFIYRTNRPDNWEKAVRAGDLYLAGFWRVPWVCQSIKVGAIDTEKKTMTHIKGIPGGIGSKYTPTVNGLRKGDGKELYYAFNLPEELDMPGEWYMNFRTGKLYFLPPAEIKPDSVLISDLGEPVLSISGAENVRVENLIFEGGLAENISISNSENVLVAGCTIRRTGSDGVKINGGKNCILQSCDLYNIGGVGVYVNGGDKKTLVPANHQVVNNHIYKFGEVAKISNAITVDGVGMRIANNLIHDGNYGGVSFSGNDHVFEYNELHNLGLDGGDLGVFYANSLWASAGSVVRYNFAHHIPNGNFFYPDDGKSTETASNNLIYGVGSGLFLGGGHDNKFLDNVVYSCKIGLHIDDRGVPRKYDKNSKTHYERSYLRYAKDNPAYDKYPGIHKIPEYKPTLPTGNIVTGNFLIDCATPVRLSGKKEHFNEVTLKDNTVLRRNPGFINPGKLDFRLKNASVCRGKLAWLNTEFPKMGLQRDAWRKEIPDDPGRYENRKIIRAFDSEKDMKASNQIEKK